MVSDTLLAALSRVVPVIAFLLTITIVAELSERAGVFEAAGAWVTRHGGRRVWSLWLLFSAFAITCTMFLSLDTTAVLLTPVALAIARQIGAAPRPFAVTTLWVANTGSLFLPMSNLTNLLAAQRFAGLGVGHTGYVRLAAAPAVVSVAVTLAAIAVLHRRGLRASYQPSSPAPARDPVLLRCAVIVCLVVGPAFALGAPPWIVSGIGALALATATAVRAPASLRGLSIPWTMAAGFAALSVAVTWADGAGHLRWLGSLAGTGSGVVDLLRVALLTAVTSNGVNNLPAYLAMEHAAGHESLRLMAILIGANAGPLVTPWGSLATLLWLQRCRAAGVTWRWWRLSAAGLACAAAAVTAATMALALTAP